MFVPPDDQSRLSQSIPLLLVLGKLPVPGRLTIGITVGQWPTAGVLCCAGIFYRVYVLASVIYDGKS